MKRIVRKSPRSGNVSDDDAELWSHVARSVKPVKKKARVLEVEIEHQAQPTAQSTPSGIRRRNVATATTTPPPPIHSPLKPVKAARKWVTPIADFDRRTAKKVGSGKIDIEARLDLHGQRLDEAHSALRRFLQRCYANNKRLVLVITGKGLETSDPYASFDMGANRSRRGVIRHSVPRWLEEPELRTIVVSYTEAGVRHGGAGALYVRLRKNG